MIQKGKYRFLATKDIQPDGWLKRQLEIQAEGLSGNLDKIWPSIRDSSWIGGDCHDWERVPYWLDGFIPLAYLLDIDDMKARAKKYIDHIIERQQSDGWLCPCTEEERGNYDIWPAFLILKVLVVYHDCTEDPRIEGVIYKALKQLLPFISSNTIFRWAATRWYECLFSIFWLYQRRPEEWLIELAYVLESVGTDFERLYNNMDIKRPKDTNRYWTQLNHVVNTAMAIKSRALMSRVTGEDPNAFAKKMYEKIIQYHGMATGHFTGDECLSGNDPVQGSECCSVAEAMFSYETLLAITGDSYWGDILERTAYNAFPATTSEDMWTHQYVQLINQVECSKVDNSVVPFNSNGGEAHTFGLEPNFGCCTANFNQAWPKLALSTVLCSESGFSIGTIAPVVVNTKFKGVKVSLEIQTQYPFKDQYSIRVTTAAPVEFDLDIRIPGFAKSATIDQRPAVPGKYHTITKEWTGEQNIDVQLMFLPEFVSRPHDLVALNRGPLLFSLPIKERWEKVEYTRDGVERKYPYCDYNIYPETDWNYAFAGHNFTTTFNEISDYPFANGKPPIEVSVDMVQVPWKKTNGFCEIVPETLNPIGEKKLMCFQPYGCTNLRMTEMPLVTDR